MGGRRVEGRILDRRADKGGGHEYGGVKDLRVYAMAFEAAMIIFDLTKSFPAEEKYSLVQQIRRSSRSVVSNLAEAWEKRHYVNHFRSKITDCLAEKSETVAWIDFAAACGYIGEDVRLQLQEKYDRIGRSLYTMLKNPRKFCHGLPSGE